MAVTFKFNDPNINIPSITKFEEGWPNIPDEKIRYYVSVEEQFLFFHDHMLQNLKHEDAWGTERDLGLSVRAGAIKAALLSYGCIVEAVLRSHAEKRNYKFTRGEDNRTFGVVIEAWEKARGDTGCFPVELQSVWQNIKDLKNLRNDIHLHKAAKSEPASWQSTLEKENEFFEKIKLVMEELKKLKS